MRIGTETGPIFLGEKDQKARLARPLPLIPLSIGRARTHTVPELCIQGLAAAIFWTQEVQSRPVECTEAHRYSSSIRAELYRGCAFSRHGRELLTVPRRKGRKRDQGFLSYGSGEIVH